MHSILTPIITGAGFLILFMFLLVRGVMVKKLWYVLLAVAMFGFAVICLFWLMVILADKAHQKINTTITGIEKQLKPRSGKEAYVAFMGMPVDTCLQVNHLEDPVIPRIDCCTWLDCNTCPAEMRRIILQKPFTGKRYAATDTLRYMPSYSPMPDWWAPYLLRDSVTVMHHQLPDDSNHDQLLIFSADSTRLFFCNMSDW